MNSKIKTAVILTALSGVVLMGTLSTVNAQDTTSKFDSMVSSLAKKLGIGEDKVQSAFDAIHKERQNEMQKLFEERLTQAVKDKKITEAQKKLILDKHNQMVKERETEWANRTKEKQELQDWASKNNVDLQYLFGGYGMGMGGGHMRGGFMMR